MSNRLHPSLLRRSDAVPRASGDRGAILVEFALLAPLLTMFAMGVVEFGFVWRQAMQISVAARAAARTGTNTVGGGGDLQTADWAALGALIATFDDLGDVERVIIYEANDPSGAPPAACVSQVIPGAGFTGRSGDNCNIYGGNWLDTTYNPASSVQFTSCSSPFAGRWWCPTSRGEGEAFGVYIRYQHPHITGMFGNSTTVSDHAVYLIEPEV